MQAATFKLYHCPATRSVRVKWLLGELIGDQFEMEIVSQYDNQHFDPDYHATRARASAIAGSSPPRWNFS